MPELVEKLMELTICIYEINTNLSHKLDLEKYIYNCITFNGQGNDKHDFVNTWYNLTI